MIQQQIHARKYHDKNQVEINTINSFLHKHTNTQQIVFGIDESWNVFCKKYYLFNFPSFQIQVVH